MNDDRPEGGEKIQWHPAFRSAFEREFRAYKDKLQFKGEFPLTVHTLFMDLVIIEVEQPFQIENELGKIFRKYNICEYKGPGDALTIDDYYKTQGSAALFKVMGDDGKPVPANEITVSLIRDAYPEKLIGDLKAEGYTFTEAYRGVFYQNRPQGAEDSGNQPFPTQIIVTKQLRKETHSGLRILRTHADPEDILRFLTEADQASDPGDVKSVNDILTASIAANVTTYEELRRERDMKYPALERLFREDLARSRAEGRAEGLAGAIGIYREELGLDDATITDRLADRFHLTHEEAARYVTGGGA